MSERKEAVLFGLTYIFLFIGQALGYSMLVRFLTAIGYSATQRSVMFAVSAALAIVVSFGLGYLFDKTKAIKKYTYAINILYLVFVYFVYVNNRYNFAYHFIMVTLMTMIFRINIGCFDSWCLEAGEYTRGKYGIIRAMGSIGWAIGSSLCAVIINHFDYIGLAYGLVLATIGAFLSYSPVKDAPKKHNSETVEMKDVVHLLGNKSYLYLVIALLFTAIMMSGMDYAVVDKYNLLNASASELSAFWSIAAILELPLFFTANRVTKKFGTIRLFAFATAVYMLRYLLYGAAGSVSFMLACTILQVVSYPIATYVSKQLVLDESPENMKSSGLQVAMAIYSQGSSLIAPLIVGIMEDSLGVNTTLYLISLFGVLSLIFVAGYLKLKKS